LRRHPDREAAFRAYEGRRKQNTDALADLCIDNFIEMRDLVGSRWFLLRKKFDILLHKLFPKWYLPLYTLVTLTRPPYADAVQRGAPVRGCRQVQAGPPDHQALGRAPRHPRDGDAYVVRQLPRPSRHRLRVPVGPVPRAGVSAGPQTRQAAALRRPRLP